METWKDIPHYENFYQASSFGRIKNKAGHILKPEFHYNGYLRVDLCKKTVCIKQYIHRIIATTFLENPSDYPLVNHKDLNKQNNAVENLEWASHKQNTQHYYSSRPVLASVASDEINVDDIPF